MKSRAGNCPVAAGSLADGALVATGVVTAGVDEGEGWWPLEPHAAAAASATQQERAMAPAPIALPVITPGLYGCSLGAGMGPFVYLAHVVARQVRVDLCGGDVGVSQHLLDVPQRHAAAQHVCGEGVA